MAKAVVAAFRDAGFTTLSVVARNEGSGRNLAEKFGFTFQPEAFLTSGHAEEKGFDVLVNVTPIGMSGANEDELSFSADLIERATTVFDVVAFPSETPLIQAGTAAGKIIISGAEVIALQAALQFATYTGVTLSAEQVRRASEFSRQTT
jgi:shikimate dehydrogenase